MASNLSKESLYKEELASSEDGLLEHQDRLLDSVELEENDARRGMKRQKSCWKRSSGSFRVLVFSHVVALVLYSLIFFAASRHYVRKFAHGPDLIYCKLGILRGLEFGIGIAAEAFVIFSAGPRGCSIRKEVSP